MRTNYRQCIALGRKPTTPSRWLWADTRRAGFGLAAGLVAVALAACGGGGDTGAADQSQGESTSGTATATLAWTAPTDSRVLGYRVYYGTSSRSYAQARGAGIDVGNTASFVVSSLEIGRTYYFAVTAYDASANESDYSSEASKLMQ